MSNLCGRWRTRRTLTLAAAALLCLICVLASTQQHTFLSSTLGWWRRLRLRAARGGARAVSIDGVDVASPHWRGFVDEYRAPPRELGATASVPVCYQACCGLGHRLVRLARTIERAALHLGTLRHIEFGHVDCCARLYVPVTTLLWDLQVLGVRKESFEHRGDDDALTAAVRRFHYDALRSVLDVERRRGDTIDYRRLHAEFSRRPSWDERAQCVLTKNEPPRLAGAPPYDALFITPTPRQQVLTRLIAATRVEILERVFTFVEHTLWQSHAQPTGAPAFTIGLHLRLGNNETGDFTRKGRQRRLDMSSSRRVMRAIRALDSIVAHTVAAAASNATMPDRVTVLVATDSIGVVDRLADAARQLKLANRTATSFRFVTLPQTHAPPEQGVWLPDSGNSAPSFNDSARQCTAGGDEALGLSLSDKGAQACRAWVDAYTDMLLLGVVNATFAPAASEFSCRLPMHMQFARAAGRFDLFSFAVRPDALDDDARAHRPPDHLVYHAMQRARIDRLADRFPRIAASARRSPQTRAGLFCTMDPSVIWERRGLVDERLDWSQVYCAREQSPSAKRTSFERIPSVAARTL